MTIMDSGNALTPYDNARHWVAQYESVDDVKEFIDKTAALEEYFRRANDTEMEQKAALARVRAERRAGELLREREMAKGARGNPGGRGSKIVRSVAATAQSEPKTLKEIGITKDQSSKYQQLADIPEQEFEETLEGVTKAAGVMGKVTTNYILNSQKPQEPSPRINTDALWLWGRLRDFEKKVLHQDKDFLLSEMTPTMRPEAERILPKLQQWLR